MTEDAGLLFCLDRELITEQQGKQQPDSCNLSSLNYTRSRHTFTGASLTKILVIV